MPPKLSTPARLDTWARAEICTLRSEGVLVSKIAARARKKDGSLPTPRSVEKVISKTRKQLEWRGEDSSAGGRPTLLTAAERKQLTDLVFAQRGKGVHLCSAQN